ncbi:glycosyltransferase [Cyclobacteriaceae bacterium YHN15]|nr:glycosyltransferase [Cyclobacteriaceae bacterium YHN15]
MKILQINTTVNSGSTGRIAEDIGKVLIENGHESYIAYGRGNPSSKSHLIKIGNDWDVYRHGLKTMFFDRHGFGSESATKFLIEEIDKIKPDVIGLHNLHGYYLNIQILFKYLKDKGFPVIWTLHDCWAFTGHCSHYQNINCAKWQSHCDNCPKTNKYPFSFYDNSFQNFEDKRRVFTELIDQKLRIVVPSLWLREEVKESFLKDYYTSTIYNGIDLNLFSRKLPPKEIKNLTQGRIVLLGVANIWQESKGIYDFIKLSQDIPEDYLIVLIGGNLKKEYSKDNVLIIRSTSSIQELADWYNVADIFINPTYLDNFPTTNIEALACGTPVITYNTGGSPESVNEQTGAVVKKGDIPGIKSAIKKLLSKDQNLLKADCRARAEKFFDNNERYLDYLKLYDSLIIAKNK